MKADANKVMAKLKQATANENAAEKKRKSEAHKEMRTVDLEELQTALSDENIALFENRIEEQVDRFHEEPEKFMPMQEDRTAENVQAFFDNAQTALDNLKTLADIRNTIVKAKGDLAFVPESKLDFLKSHKDTFLDTIKLMGKINIEQDFHYGTTYEWNSYRDESVQVPAYNTPPRKATKAIHEIMRTIDSKVRRYQADPLPKSQVQPTKARRNVAPRM